MKIKQTLGKIVATAFIPVMCGVGVYYAPNRIVDSEVINLSNNKKIDLHKHYDGSLSFFSREEKKHYVDKNFDGVLDYSRSGIVSRPNGWEFKNHEVPDSINDLYKNIYTNSKFKQTD